MTILNIRSLASLTTIIYGYQNLQAKKVIPEKIFCRFIFSEITGPGVEWVGMAGGSSLLNNDESLRNDILLGCLGGVIHLLNSSVQVETLLLSTILSTCSTFAAMDLKFDVKHEITLSSVCICLSVSCKPAVKAVAMSDIVE